MTCMSKLCWKWKSVEIVKRIDLQTAEQSRSLPKTNFHCWWSIRSVKSWYNAYEGRPMERSLEEALTGNRQCLFLLLKQCRILWGCVLRVAELFARWQWIAPKQVSIIDRGYLWEIWLKMWLFFFEVLYGNGEIMSDVLSENYILYILRLGKDFDIIRSNVWMDIIE
jgi:hypothetical protein